MDISGFHIIELPIITRRNGNHRNHGALKNGIHFKTVTGCKSWKDCLSCPKEECDYQAYPKPSKKVKVNESQ